MGPLNDKGREGEGCLASTCHVVIQLHSLLFIVGLVVNQISVWGVAVRAMQVGP